LQPKRLPPLPVQSSGTFDGPLNIILRMPRASMMLSHLVVQDLPIRDFGAKGRVMISIYCVN
jgi:hypothetical protein